MASIQQNTYTVTEAELFLSICVELSGQTEREVIATLTTEPDSASDEGTLNIMSKYTND